MREDHYDPSQEISFDGDEERSQEFRSHMLDAFAHAAGHGPHPGKLHKSRKVRSRKVTAAIDQKKAKPQESFEEFCRRLGIRMNNRKGGVEFCPGTWMAKALKAAEQPPEQPR